MPKIRQLWDLFVQAECSSYEKSSWCDLFLSQFLADQDEGHPVEEILTFWLVCQKLIVLIYLKKSRLKWILIFSNWSGVGTLIGCELLSDIDQVCSQPGNGEDLAPLRHHLYTKGWRALAVLLSLGQQVNKITSKKNLYKTLKMFSINFRIFHVLMSSQIY